MQDLLWQIKDTDSFTFYTAALLTCAVFWFIREIVDAPLLAVVSAPILMLGGVLAPIVLRAEMITFAYDNETNLAATAAAGVLTALILVVGVKWLWALLLEYQARRTRLMPVTSRPRARR
jgi:hypothetical protein